MSPPSPYQLAAEGPLHSCTGMNAVLPVGKTRLSTFGLMKKNECIVLLYVCNRIVFRRVPWRRARGKNATALRKRAMHCMSCCELLLAHGHETNDRYGTTYQCHSRSPWLGAMGSRH